MPRHANDIKIDAMMLHAHGVSIRNIAEKCGVAKSTIEEWKRKKEPKDWDEFAREVMREVLEAARQKIRVEAAEELGHHWDDTKRQRNIARAIMARFVQQLGGEDKDGKVADMKIDISEALIGGQRLVSMFGSLHDQQSALIGLPNLRLDSNAPRTPIAGVLSDKNLDDMSEAEVIQQLLTEHAKPAPAK